jgi:hypothetical protein
LLCWISPCCLWEIIWYLGNTNPHQAIRRLWSGGVTD